VAGGLLAQGRGSSAERKAERRLRPGGLSCAAGDSAPRWGAGAAARPPSAEWKAAEPRLAAAGPAAILSAPGSPARLPSADWNTAEPLPGPAELLADLAGLPGSSTSADCHSGERPPAACPAAELAGPASADCHSGDSLPAACSLLPGSASADQKPLPALVLLPVSDTNAEEDLTEALGPGPGASLSADWYRRLYCCLAPRPAPASGPCHGACLAPPAPGGGAGGLAAALLPTTTSRSRSELPMERQPMLDAADGSCCRAGPAPLAAGCVPRWGAVGAGGRCGGCWLALLLAAAGLASASAEEKEISAEEVGLSSASRYAASELRRCQTSMAACRVLASTPAWLFERGRRAGADASRGVCGLFRWYSIRCLHAGAARHR
jgi:hypothetical protein